MALLRLGSKMDLPLEAVDEYFALHNLLLHCSDANVTTTLEAFRMACTNLPISKELLCAAREALKESIEASPSDDVRGSWARAVAIQSAKKSASTPLTGTYLDKSCYVQTRMQEIVPGLFVGSYHPANDKALLKSKNITHICCCINVTARHPEDFKYIILAAEDTSSYSIRPFFENTFDFIESAITSNACVLVHCGAGISRAPTIAAAYLMRKLGVSALYAMQMIATVRTCACPNMGFRKQLEEYERELKAGPPLL